MPDYGQKATDAEFRRLRAKISDIYEQAHKEIVQKGREFAQAHAKREAKLRQDVAYGKMTQEDFDAWMRGQVFQGEQWAKKKQQMADTLYHADQVAQQMVNDSRFSVFAENANYMEYSLERDTGIDMGFGLYDADTVRRLVVEEPDLLPPKKRVGRDKSYQWYNRQIQTAITQGIIQGESIDKIARRIGKQTGETSMTAMLRNAHTMHTGAQNAGRMEGLHQAQKLGINVRKQWMATLDHHTRDAHADLDGQVQDVDAPFKSSLGDIMYPGDPTADPANVWNCRCTLVYVYPDHQPTGEGVIIAKDGTKLLVQTQSQARMQRRDNETGENIEYMTYREWEQMKQGEGETTEDLPEKREADRKQQRQQERERQPEQRREQPSERQPERQPEQRQEQPARTDEYLTNKQLEDKSRAWLEKETARMAAEWYKTGNTGISFPAGADYDKIARDLAKGKSKTELMKDYKALRRRLRNG